MIYFFSKMGSLEVNLLLFFICTVIRTVAVAQSIRAVALHTDVWVFESQPRQTQVVKIGSDNSPAKCSATDVSVTGPRR